MALTSILRSRRFRQLTAARLLFKAVRAFGRGDRRDGLVWLGTAALATRSSTLAMAAEGVLWLSRRRGGVAEQEPERIRRRARFGNPGSR